MLDSQNNDFEKVQSRDLGNDFTRDSRGIDHKLDGISARSKFNTFGKVGSLLTSKFAGKFRIKLGKGLLLCAFLGGANVAPWFSSSLGIGIAHAATNKSSQSFISSSSANKEQTPATIILADFKQNYPLKIAIGKLNSISLPFTDLVADTVDPQVQLLARGNDLLVATNTTADITLVVRDKNQPQHSLTLTLRPQKIPATNYQIVIAQLLTPQFLLNQADLTSDDYMGSLSRLLRSAVEVLQQHKPLSQAKVLNYHVSNFVLPATNSLNPKNTELVEISNPKKPAYYDPLTCALYSLERSQIREFQPRNMYYSGIKVKAILLHNTSDLAIEFLANNCTQPNVMAAVLVGKQVILPQQQSWLVLLEQLGY
ncbi:hypothetical protein CKF58_05720 [Psittacicella hinzii]|uniref:Uncharacterized protein n=2 Tax=Psittacicella hinzii TaxID=2028575 RepID=A0A3A1YH13_9GAMM|nr:hypothetical protein CKF58_05720 [Psittacicella hinzii]